jgi:hypothetical protein
MSDDPKAMTYPDRFQRIETQLRELEHRQRKSEMSTIETLVREGSRRSLMHGLGRASELLADELVYEMLRQPEIKAELLALMRQALADTLGSLGQRQRPAGEEAGESRRCESEHTTEEGQQLRCAKPAGHSGGHESQVPRRWPELAP